MRQEKEPTIEALIEKKEIACESKPSKKEVRKRKKQSIRKTKKYIGFNKFKAKEEIGAIVKSILLAMSIAFLVFGGALIAFKQIPLDISTYHWAMALLVYFALVFASYALASLVFLFSFLISFFIMKKRDTALARELDSAFGLKDGMQTSLEYADSDGAMISLLKDDLKKKTSRIKTKKHKIKGLAVLIIISVICFILPIVSMTLPWNLVEAETEEEEKTPFELTEMQKKQIESIIARVEASSMKEPAKTEVADEIKALLDVLQVTVLKSDADNLIKLSVEKIDKITEQTGTAYELHDLLVESSNPYTREIGRLVTKLDWTRFKLKREKIRVYFEHIDFGKEDADIEKIKKDTVDLVREAGIELRSALLKSGIDVEDKLYKELLKTAVGMETLASDLENGYINYRNVVGTEEQGEIFFLLSDNIFRALDEQNVNYLVGFGASDEIRRMFDIPVPRREDNGQEYKDGEEEGDTEDDDQKPSDGGGINGGAAFGSDDEIYDRDKGRIEYGEVIFTYQGIMESTEYTDEQKKIIREYFDILFRGLEEE